jgi:hypothetical protein
MELGVLIWLVLSYIASSIVINSTSALYVVVVRVVVLSTSIRRPQCPCLAYRTLLPVSLVATYAAYCLLWLVKRDVNTSYSRLLTISSSQVRCLVRWRVGRKTVSFSGC